MAVIFDEVITTIEAPPTGTVEDEDNENVEPANDFAGQFEQLMAERQRRAKRIKPE